MKIIENFMIGGLNFSRLEIRLLGSPPVSNPAPVRIIVLFIAFSAFYNCCKAQFNLKLTEKKELELIQISSQKESKRADFLNAVKLPIILIGIGAYSSYNHSPINKYEVREERNEHLPNFHTSADNFLMFAPIFTVYGLNLSGIKGKNDFRNRSLLLLKSEIIMSGLVFTTKHLTHVTRPDGSDNYSFPSGHTAQAFAAATFLSKEYGDQSVWYSIGAYSMATAVAGMRILNNKHWVSDVFTGAGIGILSTNLAYLTHRYKWKNKNSNLTVLPVYSNGPGFYISYRFK